MSVYENITNRDRIWIDDKGNILTPPQRGGGQSIVSHIRELAKPTSLIKGGEGETSEDKKLENIQIDDEAREAIRILKEKGLI